MENLYDELSKKAIASATVPRRGKFIMIKCKKHKLVFSLGIKRNEVELRPVTSSDFD